jgi:hypothetical protein
MGIIVPTIVALLLVVSSAGAASPPAPSKFQCDGKLSRMKEKAVAIRGVHVEIGFSDVRIEGAPGFTEHYKITQNSSNSVGFQSEPNGMNLGYLNRTTNRLSLSQKGEGDRIIQWFAGDCTPAK